MLGMLSDLTQGLWSIQMLAANHKPYVIIIKDRHCYIINESVLLD